jgi:hypothetical protein
VSEGGLEPDEWTLDWRLSDMLSVVLDLDDPRCTSVVAKCALPERTKPGRPVRIALRGAAIPRRVRGPAAAPTADNSVERVVASRVEATTRSPAAI